MGVRAVAAGAALAVWCMSGSAMAAGYAEVWNPPEESGHVANPPAGKKTGAAVKGKSGAAVGVKSAAKTAAKSGPKHVKGAGPAAPRVASASSGHGSKPSAQGSIKKVAAQGAVKSGTKAAGANKARAKASGVARSKTPHAQVVQAESGHGKVALANQAASRSTHPQQVKVVAKTDAAKPAASHVSGPVPSTNPAPSASVGANPANATSNPATASSGSLPPIIH